MLREIVESELKEADKFKRLIDELQSSIKRLKDAAGDDTSFNAVVKYIESEIKKYKKS